MRSNVEKISDSLLMMYLIDRVNEKGHLYGVTKLEKLVYFSERSMVAERLKGFNYNFKNYPRGPFTFGIYGDLDKLIRNEIVTEKKIMRLTPQGKKILEGCKQLLEANKDVLQHINKETDKRANKWAQNLVDETHKIKIRFKGQMRRIEDIPLGEYVLFGVTDRHAKQSFKVSAEWLETLVILLDKNSRESLEEAAKSARTERSSVHVFGPVRA